MFTSRVRQIMMVAAALFVVPAALSAQQPTAQLGTEEQQQAASMMAELQEIHGQLQQLQQQALQDAELSAAQEAVNERLLAAMIAIDPAIEQTFERIAGIQAEAMAAQQSGNAEQLQALGAEMQQIEQRIGAAQQQALQQGEVANELEAFQTRMQTRMTEIDADAGQLIGRFEELQVRLAALMQADG